MTVTADQMRGTLLDIMQVRDRLNTTEPMHTEQFTVGDAIRFEADSSWHHGVKAKDPDEPVPVFVTLGLGGYARKFQLSRSTLEDMCVAFGFKREYATDCPAELLIPHLNYWYREGMFTKSKKGKDFQIVIDDSRLAIAFTKQGMTPFSNLTLLDTALTKIKDKFGIGTVFADYKMTHSLRNTRIRLVIPHAKRLLTDTGTPSDLWSLGVQINNSLTGTSQTSIEGYLFRWVCTNGQIVKHASSGAYTRRKDASQDEVYAWAAYAVDEVLGGLEPALDRIGRLTKIGVEGSLSDTLRDIFEHYRIPIGLRPRIISLLESYEGEITMYVIMNAITQVANDASLEASTVDSLLRVGGEFAHTAEDRCGACHRIMHAH